jgi:drug/metabolite transporter (DMT)-like permease
LANNDRAFPVFSEHQAETCAFLAFINMVNSSKITPPWLWLMLAILSWSTVASACKWTLAFVHPSWMLLIATFTASFVLWLLLSFHPSCSVHQKIQWKWVFIGLINPFLYYSLLFEAYRLSPAQEALVLNYTWAVALAILSAIVFKKALQLKVLAGMLLSFLGVWLIISQGSLLVPTLRFGNFLALFSALIWAVYWILNMNHEEAPFGCTLRSVCQCYSSDIDECFILCRNSTIIINSSNSWKCLSRSF